MQIWTEITFSSWKKVIKVPFTFVNWISYEMWSKFRSWTWTEQELNWKSSVPTILCIYLCTWIGNIDETYKNYPASIESSTDYSTVFPKSGYLSPNHYKKRIQFLLKVRYFQRTRQIIVLPFLANFFEFWRLLLLIGCSAGSTNQKSPKFKNLTSFLKIPHL